MDVQQGREERTTQGIDPTATRGDDGQDLSGAVARSTRRQRERDANHLIYKVILIAARSQHAADVWLPDRD